MKRLLALLAAVCLFSGCRVGTPPLSDPFFGRTRVAPPRTGSISGRQADPYYQGSPRGVLPQTPTTQIPSNSSAPSTFSAAARSYAPASARTNTNNKLGDSEQVIRIVEPPALAATSSSGEVWPSSIASAPAEPRRLNVRWRVVNLIDLPEAGRLHSAGSAVDSGGVRLVSGAQSKGNSEGVTAAVVSSPAAAGGPSAAEFAPRASYGYDPDYAWVRGKLEYSQIDRRWKLRYIPVDGDTDRYGGSMVLPDPSVLAGCERGDFVEVRGRVGDRNVEKGFAPTYHVTEVKRLK